MKYDIVLLMLAAAFVTIGIPLIYIGVTGVIDYHAIQAGLVQDVVNDKKIWTIPACKKEE